MNYAIVTNSNTTTNTRWHL